MANQSIQLSDGTNNLYPQSVVLQDISDQITYELRDGGSDVKALYDPVNKIVKLWVRVSGATEFSTSDPVFSITSKYRPASNTLVPMVIMRSGNAVYFGAGSINTSGYIYQKFTSTATGLYGAIEYQI